MSLDAVVTGALGWQSPGDRPERPAPAAVTSIVATQTPFQSLGGGARCIGSQRAARTRLGASSGERAKKSCAPREVAREVRVERRLVGACGAEPVRARAWLAEQLVDAH